MLFSRTVGSVEPVIAGGSSTFSMVIVTRIRVVGGCAGRSVAGLAVVDGDGHGVAGGSLAVEGSLRLQLARRLDNVEISGAAGQRVRQGIALVVAGGDGVADVYACGSVLGDGALARVAVGELGRGCWSRPACPWQRRTFPLVAPAVPAPHLHLVADSVLGAADDGAEVAITSSPGEVPFGPEDVGLVGGILADVANVVGRDTHTEVGGLPPGDGEAVVAGRDRDGSGRPRKHALGLFVVGLRPGPTPASLTARIERKYFAAPRVRSTCTGAP